MDNKRTIECPQIRYHISYDENLTFKDLEDLINLIRVSNNDILHEMGITRAKANDLQRVESVEQGSITFVTALGVASSCITIGEFLWKAGKLITEKIKAEREQDFRGTRKDKKVYYRNNVTVNVGEPSNNVDNLYPCTVHIHIDNAEDINKILEVLQPYTKM